MGRRIVQPGEELPRENVLLHIYRAVSGMTQDQFSDELGCDVGSLGQYELFIHNPGPDKLARGAKIANLSLEWGDEVLRLAKTDRRKRQRQGRGPADLLACLAETLVDHVRHMYQRLLRQPLPARPPREEDLLQAREKVRRIKGFSDRQRSAVVRRGRKDQLWALAIEAGEEARRTASRDVQEAARLARLAREAAEQVQDPEDWGKAIQSRALLYDGNVLRVSGDLKAARVAFEEAKRLAEAGSDPHGLLDPGTPFDLEASLCRDERRFDEALRLCDRAFAVGRGKARALVKKAFTLEVMGEYERAIAALVAAEPYLDRQAEPRLWYKHRAQLAVVLTHVGRYSQAAELVEQARPAAVELGDEIDLLRLSWLEGRIQAGLGHRPAALWFLQQAEAEFAKRDMGYDVALALIEIAALLLEEGRTAEVKALAPELAKAFEAKGVHREALAAVQLFKEAVEQETASAALARRVLRFLFRARHDEGLKFESPEGAQA
jgi:transcriptional regulator with XRE-family HTH domain